jgi:hypothetical protein
MVFRAWSSPVSTVDLSGTWTFTPFGAAATTIQVPGGGWYKQGFTTITQADYQRTITIPDSGQPQITKLQFGAVNYEADVYINGNLVGTNITAFTPSVFDLTGFVTPGQSYALKVTVKGRAAFMVNGKSIVPNAAGWSPNTPQGIFRSAQLLIYPTAYISDEFVRPSVSDSNLYYDVWITNGTASPTNLTLSGNLTSWNGNSWAYPTIASQPVLIPAFSTTKITIGPVPWNLGAASYWWPNVPYQSGYTAQLHNLNLTLSSGATTINTDTVTFGFRQVVQQSDGTNTCYFLNGIRVNFRGDSLQGADYDSINYGGGQGDAYDTLPGFLPGTTNGWPQAVDNYQRLNYNFVRLHQEPVTPYMLQVCDQKGLMVMEETAIRGSNNDQDFILGFNNMVNHLIALFTRDRNHASIVRQSQSNEPGLSSTDSTGFETNLYNAVMAVDGTRPISVDGTFYNNIVHTNFAEFGHYGNGLGQYTETVWSNATMPYGQGEFVWYVDNTSQGLAWFATGTQAMRQQGASDIRPYTLLSAWAGFVPGVNTTDMVLEQGGHPLYGADNLTNPWTNPQILRVQAAFNPVLVADSDYWEGNKISDAAGDWPANVPVVQPAQPMTRTLNVYNDTFSGTNVDVFWELREGSTNGPMVASGQMHPVVALGYVYTGQISFTFPNAVDGTSCYLVLYAQKSGVKMFRETAERFLIKSELMLGGTPFGASPAYQAGSEYDKASDGNLSTFYDFANANGGYTGIDLGAGMASVISSIVYSPRSGFESRMVGGVFQGSNDGTNYTTLYTVTAVPSPNTRVAVSDPTAYRYLQYVGLAGSYCDIAEMAFYVPAAGLRKIGGTAFGLGPPYQPGREFDKASDGNLSTFYDFNNANGGYTGIDCGSNNAQKIKYISVYPRPTFESRMNGGTFQGSNDGTNLNYTTICTIPSTPVAGATYAVTNSTAYRYLRYVGPPGSYCNIAEMEFYQDTNARGMKAASYDDSAGGVVAENCSEGGLDVGFIQNGSWLEFKLMNLAGMTNFQARVASAGAGGNINIYLDATNGTLIGNCPVPVTGGWETWTTVTCPLSGASGYHNVYLVFTGGGGYLFNLEWFAFTGSGGDQATLVSTPPLSPQLASALQRVVLQWPDNGSLVSSLYYRPSLASTITWTPATNTPVLSNGQWTVTLATGTDTEGYYELQ